MITVSLFATLPLHPTAQLLELLQIHGQRQQPCSVACNRTNVEKDTPATVLYLLPNRCCEELDRLFLRSYRRVCWTQCYHFIQPIRWLSLVRKSDNDAGLDLLLWSLFLLSPLFFGVCACFADTTGSNKSHASHCGVLQFRLVSFATRTLWREANIQFLDCKRIIQIQIYSRSRSCFYGKTRSSSSSVL